MQVGHFSYHIKKKKGRKNYITQLKQLQLHLAGFFKYLFPLWAQELLVTSKVFVSSMILVNNIEGSYLTF